MFFLQAEDGIRDAKESRGLGDQVPKSRDQRMRTTTASAVAHLIPPMQHGHCSGSAHCEAADLVLRTSLDRAKREGLPHTALFADVASAFAATTRREFLMPSLHSEAALRELAAHGASTVGHAPPSCVEQCRQRVGRGYGTPSLDHSGSRPAAMGEF